MIIITDDDDASLASPVAVATRKIITAPHKTDILDDVMTVRMMMMIMCLVSYFQQLSTSTCSSEQVSDEHGPTQI